VTADVLHRGEAVGVCRARLQSGGRLEIVAVLVLHLAGDEAEDAAAEIDRDIADVAAGIVDVAVEHEIGAGADLQDRRSLGGPPREEQHAASQE